MEHKQLSNTNTLQLQFFSLPSNYPLAECNMYIYVAACKWCTRVMAEAFSHSPIYIFFSDSDWKQTAD